MTIKIRYINSNCDGTAMYARGQVPGRGMGVRPHYDSKAGALMPRAYLSERATGRSGYIPSI